MRIQQKYQISHNKTQQLSSVVRHHQGELIGSLMMKDRVLSPDSRAFNDLFIERYSLSPADKGLFLRLRESNNMITREGTQQLSLFAFRQHDKCLLDDHIHIGLDPSAHQNSDLLSLFEMLGLDQVVEIIKKREMHQLTFQGIGFQLMVDQVNDLPLPYVELHCFAEKSELDQAIEALASLRQTLGIDAAKIIPSTYAQLILGNDSDA